MYNARVWPQMPHRACAHSARIDKVLKAQAGREKELNIEREKETRNDGGSSLLNIYIKE